MHLIPTRLPGVIVVQPRVFEDNRGYFYELYRHETKELAKMVQVNISHSTNSVLRGLHYQLEQPQAKLISIIRGAVFDACVDIRVGSPTFGQWWGQILSDENHYQLYIPVGFAHGFCVLSEQADLIYQCSDYYHPQSEFGIKWDDKQIGIDWPLADPKLSDKDLKNSNLKDIPPHLLPKYKVIE